MIEPTVSAAQPAPPGAKAAVVADTQPAFINDLPSPKRARWSLYGMGAGIMLLLGWAAVAEIDQVTRAPATIIAAARTQLVQSPESGVVTRLHVKEGDTVTAGQLLVTLEKERAAAAVSDSSAKVAALRITLTRLQAEAYGKPLKFDQALLAYPDYVRNQTELYTKRKRAFEDDISALETILAITRTELRINQSLLPTGDVSRAEVLRLQRTEADVVAQLTNKRNKFFQDSQAEMTKAQEELSTQTEQLRDRSQLLEHTELVAPADGIVNNIRTTTPGAVVRPGDVVLELLPTGADLVAEAKINPTDIAFIEVGQAASVKLDAYDSSIFGAMNGEVSYISPDVLTEETRQGPFSYYRVRIRIKEAEFKGKKASEITVRAGLTASVDIKAMERTVLSYLTKPVAKTFSQSMGER
jgi:adhesin transport system membrane fusion protein